MNESQPPQPAPQPPRFPLLELVKGATLTQVLLIANAVVFALIVTRGAPRDRAAFDLGALLVDRGVVIGGAWRYLAAAFVHFSPAHLLLNAFGLAIFGGQLERRYRSSLAYAVVVLAAAAGGNVATVVWARDDIVLAGGASGAVFGLIGAWIVALVRDRRGGVRTNPGSLVLFAAIALGVGATNPRIGTAAHVGGLVAGMLAAIPFERGART